MTRHKHRKRNMQYYFMLTLLLAAAILGAITIQKFTGYAGSLSAEPPGVISTVIIDDRRTAYRWAGIFGLAFAESGFNETQSADLTGGEISSKVLVFECISPQEDTQEIYASTNPNITFDDVVAGNVETVDALLNFSNTTFNFDTAENAFVHNISFLHGLDNISSVPALYTFVSDKVDPNQRFYTGILNVSGDLVFVIRLQVPSTTSFKSTNVRFQAVLPVNNETVTYYFFADPNDVCPPNLGVGITGDSYVAGYVTQYNTTSPIFNATVSAGGNSTTTNGSGYFNLTVPQGGLLNLVTIKHGFITNITLVNLTIGQTKFQNITMPQFFGYVNPNATISGFVKDNDTNAIISGAFLSVGGVVLNSNGTGNYSATVEAGTHTIAAVADTYQTFIGNFTISAYENLSYIINMTKLTIGTDDVNGTEFRNGTITGFVRNNVTNQTIQNVSISLTGAFNLSDPNGEYAMNVYEGTSNLVATKEDFEAYYDEVYVAGANTTYYNFSLQPIQIVPGEENGTVIGIVFDTRSNRLEDVFVSTAGRSNVSNITGDYSIFDVVPGTHNIIATLDGYQNYYAVINVSPQATTYHNITLEELDTVGLGPGQGPGLGQGDGPGLGPGQGPGRGPGTAIEPQVEDPREIPDFRVSVKDIIKKIEEGNFINVPVTISNFIEDDLAFSLEVTGNVEPLIRLSTERMTVEGADQGEVELTILANRDPGVYEGALVFSGDIEDEIPIFVLIKEKDRLDVENLVIKITPESRKATIGGFFRYRLDIQNLLTDSEYHVNLTYRLEGINTNATLDLGADDFDILTSFSVIKTHELPKDLPAGDYRLIVTAQYLGITSEYATIFEAVPPFYMYKIAGIVPVWTLFALLGAFLLGFLIWKFFKKKADSKKRYHIELDYNQLPKQGPRSAFVGLIAETTKKAYFDLDQMQTHTLVAGSTGSGKSVAAQGIVEEALLKGTSVMVFDPTVQWTGFLSRCQDKKFLSLYPKFGLKKSDARAFNGNIYQVLDPREVIDFKKFIKPSEINVFVVNRLETKDYEVFVSNTIRQVFKENMPESKKLKLVLVFDEFHRLLPKYGGTGQVLIQVERAAREFRKWGVGLVLISQVISDFQPEVLANINTQLQMRTKDEGDLTRTKNEYGENYLQSLVKASIGAGMVENSASNKGKPYFVQFRPLLHNTGRVSDEDLENYNKYNKIIDDLDYQLEQLEKEGVDVFDLRLELKLALDKVKAGSFNMVDIYLEGLKPRIQNQWTKIGKQPQARQKQYVSEADLQAELQKAKEQQESTQADNMSAIEKAKAAKKKEKEGGESEEKPNEEKTEQENKKPPGAAEGSSESAPEQPASTPTESNQKPVSVASLLEKVQNLTDKSALKSLYATLQTTYKTASQQDKQIIMQACNLIRQKVAA